MKNFNSKLILTKYMDLCCKFKTILTLNSTYSAS